MRASDLHRLARLLREIALAASGNVGEDRVTPGQLAIIEDVAEHPGSTIGEVAERTHLAQSLVSRVAAAMREAGIFLAGDDARDRRKTILQIEAGAWAQLRSRGQNPIEDALTAALPHLSTAERTALEAHLSTALRQIDASKAQQATTEPQAGG